MINPSEIHRPESWETWNEFRTAIKWAFWPPSLDHFYAQSDAPRSRKTFADSIQSALLPGYEEWISDLEKQYQAERERMNKIEQKATTLLTQNTFIIAASAISTTILFSSGTSVSIWFRIIPFAYALFVILCFICAVLWARNTVILHYKIAEPPVSDSMDDLSRPKTDRDRDHIIDLLYSIETCDWICRLKATRLRHAHDFLRLGFINLFFFLIVLVIVALLAAIFQ